MNEQAGKTGMSTGAKVGIGCGIGCLVVIVMGMIAMFMSWRWLENKVEEFEADFAAKGMTAGEVGQMVTVTVPPTVPTFYKGQMVTLNFSEPVTVEIGVVAQIAEIVQGEFAENVYFRGQMITVKSGVKMAKELNVECQMVESAGATIEGGVTGTYQSAGQLDLPR